MTVFYEKSWKVNPDPGEAPDIFNGLGSPGNMQLLED